MKEKTTSMDRKKKTKKIFLHFTANDRKGILLSIAEFLSQMNVDITRAEINTGPKDKCYVKFECDLIAERLSLFLDTLKTYSFEAGDILRYKVQERDESGKKLVLLQGDCGIDHKKALISSAEQLTTKLVKWAKDSGDVLFHIRPEVFEELVAEIFASNGFSVELTKRSRDGGKDIIAVKYDLGIPSYWIIECKRYRERKVDVRLVRELFAVKVSGQYNNAVLVTTSTFTDPAVYFQRSVWGLSLADFNAVTSWLDGYVFTETGGLYLAGQAVTPLAGQGSDKAKWLK